jgi:lysophospholipase L1-like esterase
MAILFVQSQQALTTTGTITATYSRTPIAGNLLVAYYVCNSNNISTAPTITGWTALTAATTSTNARAERMFYKIAGSSEPTSITVTNSTGTSHLTLLEYSGIDPLNPLLVENNALPTTTTSTTYTTPTVTPATGVSALIIAGVMQKNNDYTLFTTHQINGSANGVNVRSNANSLMKSPATVFDATVASTSGTYVGTATRSLAAAAGGGAIAIFRAATTPGKILAYENWTGTNGAAWPSQWTTMANGATDGTATIQSNAGLLTSSTAGYAYGGRKLSGVSSYNQRLVIDVNGQGDGTEQYIYVAMRSNGAIGDYYPASDYYIKIPFYNGPSDAEFGIHGNNEYAIGDYYKFAGATGSSTFHIDAIIFNNQITLYAWVGSTKPSTPTYTFTDPNYTLYSPGTIALYQSNGATGVAHNATFDTMLLTTGLELTNTTAPAVTGSAYTSSVLTVSNGAWSDTPDSYLYQWYRDGITIAGATANTYTVTADDSGTKLSVFVQTVKAEYKNGGAFSNSVNATGQGINNTALPTITGTAAVGNTLTATNGSWSQAPDSYTYQWNRSGVAIAGATNQTYVLVGADSGVPITVTVTAIKASYANGTATSNSVTPTAATFANTVLPAITGTQTTGQTLTVSNGTWNQTPDSYAYQWNRDGAAIAGATAQTYVLQTYDQGLPVTAVVTATKSGTGVAATTAAVTPAAAAVSDKMSVWKAALANRVTTPATLTAIGSLTSEGMGASTRSTRWIERMRDALRRNYRTAGIIGGEGYVPAGFATGGPWADWYTSKTGTVNFYIWAANLGYRLMMVQNSSSITYTFTGTDIDIAYSSGDTAFSYSVDGGTAIAVANDPIFATNKIQAVTGLTAGTHTITISTSASQTAVINGFYIYNGDRNKGIRMIDASHSYFATSSFNDDINNFTKALRIASPSLITLELGIYDAAYNGTPADFKKQLQILVNALQGAWQYAAPNIVPSILIIASFSPSSSNTSSYPASWSQYVAAMQAVANTAQVGFLDLSLAMAQADTTGASYYNSDGLTLNDYGHHKVADLVFKTITDSTAAYLQGPQTWYRALANRASAPAKWTGIGDSLTEGQGATSIDKTWASIVFKTLRNNYPVLNVPGGFGYRPGQYNVYAPDSTWTNWYSATSGTINQYDAGAGPGYRMTFLAQNASRTYPFFGTDIDVWVNNSGGTIRYSIDGGAATDVPTANDGGMTISSKSGLTRGQHSITITTPSSAGASFSGFMIYDGDRTKGLQYYEGSHSGAKTSLYLSDLPHFLQNMQTIAPSLITISIGDNDSGADGVATVMNNVITLAGALSDLPGSPSIVFIAPYFFGTGTTVSSQAQYNEGYKIITQAIGATLLDMSTMVPTTDTSGTGYYSTDAIHLNNTGHAFIAQKFLPTLADARLIPASAGTVLATETWSATNGSSWPSQWTVTTANGGTIDVQNGMGRVITPTANYSPPGNTYLTGMPAATDTEILMDFMVPNVSIEQYALIGARIQTPTWNAIGDPTTGYIFNVYPSTGNIEVLYSGPFTSLQVASYPLTSGVTYTVRWQLIGSRTRVRIWPKANTEPSTWNIDVGGASDLTAGKVAVFSESGGAGAAQIYYDNLTVIAPLQTGKVYIGNQLRPLGYIGSRPITAVYIGSVKVQ